MRVGSLSENLDLEKRVAITPEVLKKYKSLGIEINLIKNFASHLGFTDQNYEAEGVNILSSDDEVLSNSDLILQMNIPRDEILNKLKKIKF